MCDFGFDDGEGDLAEVLTRTLNERAVPEGDRPVVDLWASVFLRGIKDCVGTDGKMYREEAFGWLFEDDEEKVGSAAWICFVLDLNVLEATRRFVVGAKPENVKQLRKRFYRRSRSEDI